MALNNKYLQDFWCYAIRPGIVKRSLIIAVIVGTVLNLINQGDVIAGNQAFNLAKCLLTYVVPYCVSTYGSVTALMAVRDNPEALGSCEVEERVPGESQTN